MNTRILSMVAAVALLAACESQPEGAATTTGAGAAQPAATTTAKPAGIQPGTQADLVANVGDRVFFDFDKYDVKPDARATLEKQAAWLKKYPSVSLVVEGHCDERGTREYNLALGERRANAVKDYLVAMGVQASRLKTISYGKERPVALGSTDASYAQNRRGVSVVQ